MLIKIPYCGVCKCPDCKSGWLRDGRWKCPLHKKWICSVCCRYDQEANDGRQKCIAIGCKKYKEINEEERELKMRLRLLNMNS